MADDTATSQLLETKRNDSSPPPYSLIQSTTSPASNRNGLSHKCVAASQATTAAVVRAPRLDDRVVSAVIRSVPPLERALSVPDSHANVAVMIDESGRAAGRGSLKVARRSDSARSNKAAVWAAVAADVGVDQMDPVAAGTTTTRRADGPRSGWDDHDTSPW